MSGSASLRDRVEWFVENSARIDDLQSLLRECVDDGSLDALVCVRRLYEHMYGGFTYNFELKSRAAATLLIWKELGLDALIQGARAVEASKNTSITLQLLSSLAAGDNRPMLFRNVGEPLVDQAIQEVFDSCALSRAARSHLVDYVLSFADDEEASSAIGFALVNFSVERSASARELFAALSRRWLAVSTPVLEAFDELIRSQAANEPVFQEFLTSHPQILDPLAIRIWPQPNLFGFREPDFVVQRADGTYLVVEIECPAKSLVTGGGQLTADVTHAEQQVADYRRYLIKHFSEAEKHFPQFQEPDCLVVIGNERDLSDAQQQALRDANHGRHRLRIAGFDWLLNRARTIAANITQPEVEVIRVRMV